MSIMPSIPVRVSHGKEIVVRPMNDGGLFIQGAVPSGGGTVVMPLHMTPDETRAVAQEIARASMAATETFPHPQSMNAREQLQAALDMLNFTHESLSMGLRSPEDAIRLWRAWSKHAEDAHPDQWEASELVAVLGYNPFTDALPVEHRALAETE